MTKDVAVYQKKATDLRNYLNSDNIKKQFQMAVPKWLSVDRLLRVFFTAAMKNPGILDCTLESILSSVMQCAQLGLEPVLGRAYLIPYNNSKNIDGKWVKVKELQFQAGYQGLVDLARRSNEIKDIYAKVVYEKDEFIIEYGTDRKLTHKPWLGSDPGDPIGAYAVWEHKTGIKSFEFMPLHEIFKRRDRSQGYLAAKKYNKDDNPWIQWPEEMMTKTVVKHSSKMQPASIEFMQAVELDVAADIGRSQVGLFSDDVKNMLDYSTSGKGPDEKVVVDTSRFDMMVAKNFNPGDSLDALNKFIQVTADANGVSVDELKAAAADSFDEFWSAFEVWNDKGHAPADCVCQVCGFEAKSEQGLKRHITQQHSEPEKAPETENKEFDPEAEKAVIIKELNGSHSSELEAVLQSYNIGDYALEEISLDMLTQILAKCKEVSRY